MTPTALTAYYARVTAGHQAGCGCRYCEAARAWGTEAPTQAQERTSGTGRGSGGGTAGASLAAARGLPDVDNTWQTWLNVPYPPSLNHYWRYLAAGRVLISQEGRTYRHRIAEVVALQWDHDYPRPLYGRLTVTIDLYPPDRRVRDIDNFAKVLLDALAKADVFVNDSQIDELRIVRWGTRNPAHARVTFAPWQFAQAHER